MKLAAALLCSTTIAHADRPILAGEATYGEASGRTLVHYATTGNDAVPPADADTDGVPDFVEQVARAGDTALAHYAALGFRAPRTDGALGGDARVDVYLRDLVAADGSTVPDACSDHACTAHAIAENDYAGFTYPSITEAIETVVPHELFHVVQLAYSNEQTATWTEGSAVWAVEHLHGDANGDFERFLPAFLGKTFRPFERPVAGFGDNFPYGAALWPHYLATRDVAIVVDAWERSATAPFLDAIAGALEARNITLAEAWIDFTRWNAATGSYVAPDGYGAAAAAWSEAVRTDTEPIYVEGFSARYVPLTITERSRVSLAATIAIAGFLLPDGAALADGIALVDHAAIAPPGTYTLVVTGLQRGAIVSPVTLAIEPALDEPPDDDSSGCATTTPSNLAAGLALLALLRRRNVRAR